MPNTTDHWRNWKEEDLVGQLSDQNNDPSNARWIRAKAVLDYKIAQKHLSHATQLASSTRWLAVATGALLLATVGLIVATVYR